MCVVLLDPKTYTSSVSGYLVLKVLLAKRKAREVDWSKNERATGRGAREITRTLKIHVFFLAPRKLWSSQILRHF